MGFYVKQTQKKEKGVIKVKYNLKKKTTLWKLFNKELKIAFSLIVACLAAISFTIKEIQLLLLKALELAVTYGIYILIPLNIWFYGSLVYYWGRYFYRHLFVPLSKEEMEENNIHTLPEYLYFLRVFFDGKLPLKRVRTAIEDSAKQYLNKDDNGNEVCERDFHIFSYNIYSTPVCLSKTDVGSNSALFIVIHFAVYIFLYVLEIRIPLIVFAILPIVEYFICTILYWESAKYWSCKGMYRHIHFHLFRIGHHFDMQDYPTCEDYYPWKGYYKFNDKFKEVK